MEGIDIRFQILFPSNHELDMRQDMRSSTLREQIEMMGRMITSILIVRQRTVSVLFCIRTIVDLCSVAVPILCILNAVGRRVNSYKRKVREKKIIRLSTHYAMSAVWKKCVEHLHRWKNSIHITISRGKNVLLIEDFAPFFQTLRVKGLSDRFLQQIPTIKPLCFLCSIDRDTV